MRRVVLLRLALLVGVLALAGYLASTGESGPTLSRPMFLLLVLAVVAATFTRAALLRRRQRGAADGRPPGA